MGSYKQPYSRTIEKLKLCRVCAENERQRAINTGNVRAWYAFRLIADDLDNRIAALKRDETETAWIVFASDWQCGIVMEEPR